MIKIDLKRHRKEIIGSVVVLLILLGGMSVFKYTSFNSGFEIVDDLGGNIFPSAILSVATTDAQVIVPSDSTSLGNPKSCIAVRLKSKTAYSRVRIEVAETPFFSRSVSEFVLNKPRTEYTIYPDIIWNYEALKNEVQAEPVSVAITVEMNGKDLGQRVRTFSVRSINECLLGYVANGTKFHDTSIFFAAYVNEENPMIDQLLREALNTRIVNRFLGYQSKAKGAVDKQVYALWNILQKRKFRYSSVSNTSLSSNVVFSQRVRTFDDALESSQINCVDGSVLFASLLRAINIDPILVRTPGHMFVGYYTDNSHTNKNFLETTMIGDVDLDDFGTFGEGVRVQGHAVAEACAHGDDQVGVPRSGHDQNADGGAVAVDAHGVQRVVRPAQVSGLVVHQRDVVLLLRQLLGDGIAYLAAAYNYDAHTAPPIFYTEWRRAPMKRPPPAGRIPRPCYYWIIAFRRRKSNMQSTVLKTF